MKKKTVVFLILVSISFSVLADMKAPLQFTPKKRNSPITNLNKTVFSNWVLFYSKVISPADGARSLSYPTGSAYGYQAIQEEGVLVGVLLIGDRLFHEADQHYGSYIRLYGIHRYYDPIENNVFWWKKKQQK